MSDLLRLGEACTKIGSGATPRGGRDVYLVDGPFTLIRSQNVYNGGFFHEGLAHIGEQHAHQLRSVEVQTDDVLLNITGDSVARACQVQPDVLPARVNQHVAILRPDPDILDARYLRYWLISPETQATLLSWARSGGTRNALTKAMIESLVIPAPPLAHQRRIAHILGTLDEKIELNRRMNATLERMAQALFKSWFVDFEPVRAKMEGRWRRGESLPGMSAELYHLFPKRLVLSKLGEVPEGWKIGTIDDIARSPRRNVSPSNVKASTPYIGLQRMPRRSIALTEWSTSDEVTSTKATFKKGEILFGKLRPYFHKVGIAPLDGLCSTDIVVLTPTTDNWSAFLLCCVSTDEFVGYTDQTSTGTRMPRTSWKAMKQFETCLPPNALASAFQRITEPMLKRIVMNCHESQSLAKMRDALLPGLVSENVTII